MTMTRNYLAVDLGAESGRTILGVLDNDRLKLTETHRFINGPVRLNDGIHWDVLRLWSEIKTGIATTIRSNASIDGIALDSWGVDFALLDKSPALLSNPFHYRDVRTDGMLDEAFRRMPRPKIFSSTGIQFMQINTLYQLLATCVLDVMGIPTHLFKPVTEPGTQLGTLLPQVAEETGTSGVQIVVPACHDTGSAVVAVPALAGNQDFAWISSGTWSIMGAEVRQ